MVVRLILLNALNILQSLKGISRRRLESGLNGNYETNVVKSVKRSDEEVNKVRDG